MTEQEKNAWADLKRLVDEYGNVCRTGRNDKEKDVLFNQLNAALELYHNNKIINISEKDVANLKIGFHGIRKYPDAVTDVMKIIGRFSGENRGVKLDLMQGALEKIFNGRQE